jgi:glucose/arabinose dehydrogenase
MFFISPRPVLAVLLAAWFHSSVLAQKAHTLRYGKGRSITLSLPDEFDISVAASGLKRVRFFAKAPDGRIFVTGMHDLSDNREGSVFILEGWNAQTAKFTRVTRYLDHLRNPNSVAFWTDPTGKQSWIYVALTSMLMRYRYNAGEEKPSSAPEVLMRFPDYGLNYKYGGWHLTRTVAVARVGAASRIFVSVGSSCNYCAEPEVARASVISMDPDGKNRRVVAQGLRNAVGMEYVPELDGGALFVTNQGADHLGDNRPDETFFKIQVNPPAPVNYGWPVCYFDQGTALHDTTPLPSLKDVLTHNPSAGDVAGSKEESIYGEQAGLAAAGTNLPAGGGHVARNDPDTELGKAASPLSSCAHVPLPYATFRAHSSALGFAYFTQADPLLRDSFVLALHGAGHPRIGAGYKVIRFNPSDRKPRDFITGFFSMQNGRALVHGRPCGILRVSPDSFLLTDDYLGLIYYVRPRGASAPF